MTPYPIDICYDIETYPNVFSAVFLHVTSGREWIFEVSDRRNDSTEMHDFLRLMQRTGMRMVGYNNVGFDYPVIHEFVNIFAAQGTVHAHQMHAKANQIIRAENRWANIIWPDQRIVPQLDLYLIHHFDNKNKQTSLKMLEVNMRSHDVQDLPFDPTEPVPLGSIDDLIRYNRHDVAETAKFYKYSLPMIEFRQQLSEKYGVDWLNHNDTKIGKDFFIMELEKVKQGLCFEYQGRKKVKRQTPRKNIPIGPIILPYIQFEHPEFNRVLNYMRGVTLTTTKKPPEFKDLHAIVGGFQFDFGAGGLHGSIERRVVRTDETHVIIDADVVSYYPSIPIKNRFYPEHLTEVFCDVYSDLLKQRRSFPKGTPENAMLKLALNGVYGESNQEFGVFLDPRYTMQVTINGQLSLAMLSEQIIKHCDGDMIQANTDGITVRIPRNKRDTYDKICEWWQELTGLDLEFVDYDGMWIRDVNSYLSRSMSGKIKRIGAYQYHTPLDDGPVERGWHQDLGGLIIPKAAEAVMLRGESLETFIRSHRDPFDFMLRVKVPRSSRLVLHTNPFPTPIRKGTPPVIVGYKGTIPAQEQVQNISRYYIAKSGKRMTKIMPHTGKVPEKAEGIIDLNPKNERYISVEAGHDVALCNVASDFDWDNLRYEYYIEEARKLLLTPGDLFATL